MKQLSPFPSSETGCIYPGEYVALAEMQALLTDLNPSLPLTSVNLPVNIDDRDDAMEIEIVLPGIAAENLLVLIRGDNLYVIVKPFSKGGNTLRLHTLDDLCLDRILPLPLNADTEFVTARFRLGKLCIYVPRSDHPLKPGTMKKIVVY